MCGSVTNFLYFNSKGCKRLPKKLPLVKKITKMQKNLVKLSYLAQKVLQRGRVPVLQLVDLPSIPTQNNGRKTPIFVLPCILPSHTDTGFKNIFTKKSIFTFGRKVENSDKQSISLILSRLYVYINFSQLNSMTEILHFLQLTYLISNCMLSLRQF